MSPRRAGRQRQARSLRRSTGTKRVRPVFHLYLEGEITEREYFTALGSDPRYRATAGHGGVTIRVVRSQGHPEELVRAACRDQEAASGQLAQARHELGT